MHDTETPLPSERAAPDSEVFPVMDLTFQFLGQGKQDRFEFIQHGAEALDNILRALFLTATNHDAALTELLRLAVALREQLQSPTAAQQIVEALLRSKPAMQCLNRDRARRNEVLSAFSRFQGSRGKRIAPTFGSEAPRGSVKVASFLTPAQPQPGVRLRRPNSRTR
ncbi:MAG: hypothetical protein H6729_02240 [Deltaproteobacteria bacterium]|nr:hypothetical protein [Deltaproteobacteria bacterium]